MPKAVVEAAARAWAQRLRREKPEVVRVGYFGSYATGNYAPGSDLDVLIELSASEKSRWVDRIEDYDPKGIPVPVDVFPYTTSELEKMRQEGRAFLKTIMGEIVWLE